MIRRPNGPGVKSKKFRKTTTEYGIQLREKQKVKETYGLRERQFQKYVLESLNKKSREKNFPDFLLEKLELRLDNAAFRMGIASSRNMARQLVNHGYFLVNGNKVDTPSLILKVGDVISIREASLNKKVFQNLKNSIKKHEPPSWLNLEKEKLEGKIVGLPTKQEVNIEANLQTIGEFYSR